MRDLHKSLYFQLTNTALPALLRETSEVFAALQEAAVGQNVLLVIDDAWNNPGKIAVGITGLRGICSGKFFKTSG